MEWVDLYTYDRQKTDIKHVRGEKQPEGYYRLIVHVCIFNSKGELLIQQRQTFKRGWPGLWDVSVAGGVTSGDTSWQSAERELKEELGIDMSFEGVRPHLTIDLQGGFDDYYIVNKDIDLSELKLQYEEVKDAKWATLDEVLKMMDEGVFVPFYRCFMELLFKMSKHRGTHDFW